MNQTILSRFLASRFGAWAVKTIAFRDPARHLYDLDGSCYMGRWHVVREGSFASRVLERLTGYASIRLHQIMRADHDRDLHNHPFDYRTFVVGGYYSEQYQLPGTGQRVKARSIVIGETAATKADTFHRISSVSPGGVWTLFCMTRNTYIWGFKVKGRFVKSDAYLKRRGYRQPGKDVQ